MSTATYIVYEDKKGEWRWQLKSSNNVDVLADSGEGYKSEEYCFRMARWISANTFPVVAGHWTD